MNIFIIITKAGLCNRLQEILSYRDYALQNNYTKIYFLWENTTHCRGNVFEIIDNIPDIEFLTIKSKNHIIEKIYENKPNSDSIHGIKSLYTYVNDEKIFLSYAGGCGKHLNFIIINPCIINFSEKIVTNVDNYIEHYLNNNYIAIHIRKQDNRLDIDHNVIKKLIDEHYDHCKVYLATDCVNIQKQYLDKYKKIITNKKISDSFTTNRANIVDAVFDILVCAKAKTFCGTPDSINGAKSSYSNFIYGLRGVYEKALTFKSEHFIHIK